MFLSDCEGLQGQGRPYKVPLVTTPAGGPGVTSHLVSSGQSSFRAHRRPGIPLSPLAGGGGLFYRCLSRVSRRGSTGTARTGGHHTGQELHRRAPRWTWGAGSFPGTVGSGAGSSCSRALPGSTVLGSRGNSSLINSALVPGLSIMSSVCHAFLQVRHHQSSSQPWLRSSLAHSTDKKTEAQRVK